jgi:CheY-specific phosphatase CheX
MQETELQQIFLESTEEALEAMFFTGISSEAAEETGAGAIAAELKFQGSLCGRFGLRMPPATARSMAANFLGLEEAEIVESQVAEVACELTNIICGSVLTRYESGARFELLHPEIDSNQTDWRQFNQAFGCTFGVDEGSLTVWMAVDTLTLRRN